MVSPSMALVWFFSKLFPFFSKYSGFQNLKKIAPIELMRLCNRISVETVSELEGMIQSQNQVMAKLKDECHNLTQRLEESSARHK
jgi:hypothetical protein